MLKTGQTTYWAQIKAQILTKKKKFPNLNLHIYISSDAYNFTKHYDSYYTHLYIVQYGIFLV